MNSVTVLQSTESDMMSNFDSQSSKDVFYSRESQTEKDSTLSFNSQASAVTSLGVSFQSKEQEFSSSVSRSNEKSLKVLSSSNENESSMRFSLPSHRLEPSLPDESSKTSPNLSPPTDRNFLTGSESSFVSRNSDSHSKSSSSLSNNPPGEANISIQDVSFILFLKLLQRNFQFDGAEIFLMNADSFLLLFLTPIMNNLLASLLHFHLFSYQ